MNEIMIMTKRALYMIINMTSTRMTRISLKILTIMDILSKTVKIYNARSRPDLFLSLSRIISFTLFFPPFATFAKIMEHIHKRPICSLGQ